MLQFTPPLKNILLVAGFLLSTVLGVAVMGLDRGATAVEPPGETVAQTNFRASFELRVTAPEKISLSEEALVLNSFKSALLERFPDLDLSDTQTLEGYRIDLKGNVVGSVVAEKLAPIYSDIKSFSTDYVTRHYRAKLVFDKPFNYTIDEGIESSQIASPSLARLITGGAFGVALYSLILLVIMIAVEGRNIISAGEAGNGPGESHSKAGVKRT